MKTLRRTLWALSALAMVLAQPAYADEAIAHELTVSVHSKQPDPAGVDEDVTVVFDLSPYEPAPPSGESVDSKWKHQRFYLTTEAAGAGNGDNGVISSVTVGAATVTREQAPKVVGIYTVSWPAANVVQIMQTGHSGPGCGVCTPQEMVRQLGLVAAFAEPGKKLVACRGGIDHDKWVPPTPDDPIIRVDTYTDTKTGKVLKTEETPVWGACQTSVHVPKLEVFIGQSNNVHDAANFTVELTDYPAQGPRPRNPQYMFGKEDPIFIQVTKMPAGQQTLLRRVRVSSESEPQYVEITLKESSADSGVYRNVITGWEELLYVGDESGGYPAKVKAVSEEVVTFRFMNSSGADARTLAEYQVMVDRAECGSGYYNYVDVPGWPQLNSTTDIHNDFIKMLTDTKAGYDKPDAAPVLWSTYEGAGDAVCRKSHYAEPTDANKADAADIVIWSGHGTDTGTPNNYYCAFLDINKNIEKLHHGDVKLGNTDAEWAIFQTCRFLNTSKEESNGPGHGTATDDDIETELKQMFAGCHLVMGYKTKMLMYAHFSEKLIYCTNCEQGTDHGLDQGFTIPMAFSRATWDCPMLDQDMVPRIFGADDCWGDTLYSEGAKKLAPVPLSRDPLATDGYHYEEWTVPQAD